MRAGCSWLSRALCMCAMMKASAILYLMMICVSILESSCFKDVSFHVVSEIEFEDALVDALCIRASL